MERNRSGVLPMIYYAVGYAMVMAPVSVIFGLVFAEGMLASNGWPFLTPFSLIIAAGMAIGGLTGAVRGLRHPLPPAQSTYRYTSTTSNPDRWRLLKPLPDGWRRIRMPSSSTSRPAPRRRR